MNDMNNVDIYKLFNEFLSRYDLYPKPVPGHPGYTATQLGHVYKPDGSEAKQFNSCGYKQVRMIDDTGNRSIKGVHQVVAMTFDECYFPDCVVHHIDEDKHNNCLETLQCDTRSNHSRMHANPAPLQKKYIKENGPANKGKHGTQEFRDKCRQSTLNRWRNHKKETCSDKSERVD